MTRSPPRRRLGVIGTFVWDVIHGCPPHDEPAEGMGGIGYALAGLDAALPDDWEIVPIVKVGADVAARAREFLATLTHRAPADALLEVPEPNNRTTLRYFTEERRTETLSGGVPRWRWAELEPLLGAARLDALYVNFLSGWELDVETARRVRALVNRPTYVDLHMLLWKAEPSGLRRLRPLADAAGWYRCFDIIQVNEEEMATLATDSAALAADASREGVVCTIVTLGRRGAEYFAAPSFGRLAQVDSARDGLARDRPPAASLRTVTVPPQVVREGEGVDPTGCGDVWGATCFARLLCGDSLGDAMLAANRAASYNVGYRGADGLASYLAARTTRSV